MAKTDVNTAAPLAASGQPPAVVITGVGKRLGLALAQALLAQGYRVIGSYRSHYPAIDALTDAGARLFQGDFYQPAAVDDFIEFIHRQSDGNLRAVIHNASDWLPDNHNDGPAQVMQRMMQVHVTLPYQLNMALKTSLAAGEGGDIIHITDYVAARGSKKHIAYAASKAALANLSQSFAAQLAPAVKVNEIAPALLLFNPDDAEDYRAKALNKALLPREGGFEEVIDTVNFLLNSGYITGRCINLDGGRHLR